MSSRSDPAGFEQILQHLRQTRRFDFSAYKRSTLMRRLLQRMHAIGVPTFEEYLDYLQGHQDELVALFNTILVNVTSFFRDKDVWNTLRAEILPAFLRDRNGEPLRVWSAGCASGQEPYSLAMILAEQFGTEAVRDRITIYATDVDEEALSGARQATYQVCDVSDVPPALREKYFDRTGSTYTLNRDLQRAVIVGRHDLAQDAPISQVDLLLCRNTLMYFNAEAQSRILARFSFSLNPGGLVVLGRAEMLFSQSAMFTPLDLKRRVFRAVSKPSHGDRAMRLARTDRGITANPAPNHARLRDVSFDSADVAVAPLFDDERESIGTRVGFHDVTDYDEGRYRSSDMNTLHSLTIRTTSALNRLAELQRRAQRLPPPGGGVVRPALKELTAALEELQVANEQLQSHVDELAAARVRADEVAARFDEFADLLPVPCLWTDDAGVIREANEAAAQLLNVARPRLAGKPLMLFLGDRQRFFDGLAALRMADAGAVELDMVVRPRERRSRTTRLFGRRAHHDDRWCWFVLLKDEAGPGADTTGEVA
jgi:chemotaxis methyl-accepting protein methylase/PAS domain-containing protein